MSAAHHGLVTALAENLLDQVDWHAKSVRVCAACEKEFGAVQTEPGQPKTNGTCRRHAIDQFGQEIVDEMDDDPDAWVPDMAERGFGSRQ